MLKHSVAGAAALAACLCVSGAGAQSSFTETCSNYGFAYSGNQPALEAVCLKKDGTPHATSLILTGIVVVNGVLDNLNSGVPSNFQTMCGSIDIYAEGPIVTLSAYCRMNNNQFTETSTQLNNINNNDGTLVQGR
ncbi:MAG: cyanovirin containing protein [Alphaproteobacteria bacterium]|nr:cyanovirin containing protein [Alphaproteobacteria bacterium]